MRLPDELNLLIPYDVAVAVYLGLFCMLMERTSPEDAAEITWRGEPNDRRVQTYSYGALSAYAQVATSDQQFIFAGGFQSATNVAGNALSTRGFATGKYAYFIISEWVAYCLFAYGKPSVPQPPGNSLGISFNAVQNIDGKWGLFLARSRSRPRWSGVGSATTHSGARS